MRGPFQGGFTPVAVAELLPALKALADPHRLAILSLLNQHGEMTVSELVLGHATLSQPTVSHHVRVLADAGLVARQKRGVFTYVRLDSRAVAEVASALDPWQAS